MPNDQNRKSYSIESEVARILARITFKLEDDVGERVFRKDTLEALIECVSEDDEVYGKVLDKVTEFKNA